MQIEVTEVNEISPHNKAVYEAGKAMLIDSISTSRDFCQSMITTSTSAIPVYLGILTFILPEKYVLGFTAGATIALPAIAFLVASIIFTAGYLPVASQFSLDLVDEVNKERNRIISYRKKLITVGFTIFVLGTFAAIIVVVVNLGVR